MSILVDLQRKVQILRAEGQWQQIHHALFSKSGFTPEFSGLASKEGILVEATDLVKS
ncbi:MAG: hypothetical protein KF893_11675 [Caldilineaceae bacterium]|nr:hypothetical protein [Caldilineaceae bacterium]